MARKKARRPTVYVTSKFDVPPGYAPGINLADVAEPNPETGDPGGKILRYTCTYVGPDYRFDPLESRWNP